VAALVKAFEGISPQIGSGVRLAENATVVGDVVLGEGVNVWYGSVIRADVGRVRVGRNANLQDLCCIHMTKYKSDSILGDDVSIGHAAIVHGAIIEEGVLVGMGAIVMDNARIGAQSIVGAGSLVTENVVIPPRSLVLGRPGRVVRTLTDVEILAGAHTSQRYLGLAAAQLPLYPAQAPGVQE
jgi:gamma-carbonic anhydrase